ncbi:MAG TPA: protein phosphatase 2C domain-containing protein [Moraxellaceae bacterium]|nr:protein phosphatase 2C domain-containing protein [Moraxellaceae bacterium]
MFEVAYTQHRGKQNPSQQDALWNGIQAVQHTGIPSRTHTILNRSLLLAVADGVSVSPVPHIASLFIVQTLGLGGPDCPLTTRRLRDIHGLLCDRYAKGRTWGTSSTLVAIRCAENACEVINTGDSRAYRISSECHWEQLSHDHTILNEMIASGQAQAGQEYAGIYQGLAHCLVADDEEDDFAIHCRQFTLLTGDSVLLCSDGVHDTLGDDRLRSLYSASYSPLAQVKTWRKAVMDAGAPDNFSIVFARKALI